MSDAAIRIEGLGKRYRLGQQVGYKTLRETLLVAYHTPTRILAQTVRRTRRPDAPPSAPTPNSRDFIWALKDVSFDLQPGQALGVIGRNGSGKSTLLKILSRITAPTEGRVEIRGRVGSLLEVGTGFHPELTGRENIYLNGAIIGMKKAEIERKFDEIVAFAEIEEFLDTPVKRYSSGMYVRLAFAVAAHLEPEILLVDEVLAVGDATFQKKCLGKMGDVTKEGRTVLFVSHNMSAIRQLCSWAVQLERGKLVRSGTAGETIDAYLRTVEGQADTAERLFAEDPNKVFQLTSARLLTEQGSIAQEFTCDRPVVIELVCVIRETLPGLYGYLSIARRDGTLVLESDSHDGGPNPFDRLAAGTYSVRLTVPARTLGPGDYSVYLNFASPRIQGFNVDSPGVVCTFHLDDFSSTRGNRRGGFFSTLTPWVVAPRDA